MPAMEEYIEFLSNQETFDNKDVLNVLKGLGRMYWDMKTKRGEIGDKLAEKGFAGKQLFFIRAKSRIRTICRIFFF